jgi:hypothetical protein
MASASNNDDDAHEVDDTRCPTNSFLLLLVLTRDDKKFPSSAAELRIFSSSIDRVSKDATNTGSSTGPSTMTVLMGLGNNCTRGDCSKIPYRVLRRLATAFAGPLSTNEAQSADWVAASPRRAASSTRISCMVDPLRPTVSWQTQLPRRFDRHHPDPHSQWQPCRKQIHPTVQSIYVPKSHLHHHRIVLLIRCFLLHPLGSQPAPMKMTMTTTTWTWT